MHESLFASCIRGARAVLGLARTTLADAAARRGKDAHLSYPGTAYELPVAFGLTDISV